MKEQLAVRYLVLICSPIAIGLYTPNKNIWSQLHRCRQRGYAEHPFNLYVAKLGVIYNYAKKMGVCKQTLPVISFLADSYQSIFHHRIPLPHSAPQSQYLPTSPLMTARMD